MAIQRTFSIIKPDATRRNLTGAINAKLEAAGLRIIAQKRIHLTLGQAQTFYGVHKDRPFFGELTEFISSAPIVAQVLEGEDAVAKNREVMGATNPAEAAEAPSARSSPSRSARTRCTAPTAPTPPPPRSPSSSRGSSSLAEPRPRLAGRHASRSRPASRPTGAHRHLGRRPRPRCLGRRGQLLSHHHRLSFSCAALHRRVGASADASEREPGGDERGRASSRRRHDATSWFRAQDDAAGDDEPAPSRRPLSATPAGTPHRTGRSAGRLRHRDRFPWRWGRLGGRQWTARRRVRQTRRRQRTVFSISACS